MLSSNQTQVHRAEHERRPVAIAILLLCVGLALGCSSDVVAPSAVPSGPNEAPVPQARTISQLYVKLPYGTLFTIGEPGHPLEVAAIDQAGQPIDVSRSVTFVSSLPAVATVDAGGVVTAVASGNAEITASVTTGLITRSASIIVSVVEPPLFGLSGTYDFEARGVDWGNQIHDFTAVFSFPGPSVTVGQIGTFTDWQDRSPEGKAVGLPRSGTIRLFYWDRPMLYLGFAAGGSVLLRVKTIAESPTGDRSLPSLQGVWEEDDVWAVSGTFTATRRAP